MTGQSGNMVCIVDDDDAVRDSLKVMLQAHGMQVRDFASASEFLKDESALRCRCLILDLHMPVMSGMELLETLRANNVGVPTLMVTGRPDADIAERLRRSGSTALLAKPVTDSELLGCIEAAFTTSLH